MRIILAAIVIVLMAGCGRERQQPAGVPITQLEYSRTGGGGILFTVRQGNGAYVYRLAPSMTAPPAGNAARSTGSLPGPQFDGILADIFSGKVAFGGSSHRRTDPKVDAGTWVSVKVLTVSSNWVQVENQELIHGLRPLEDFVRAELAAAAGRTNATATPEMDVDRSGPQAPEAP